MDPQKERQETAPTKKAEGLPNLKERGQFRALLLSNPNYFGNLKISPFKPVLKIQGNTTYEEIGCVGYEPALNRLEAVAYVKQPTGYGGGVCSNGTPEFVRFYLSFDNGATWQDQGLTSFQAYDIPEGAAGVKPLEYAVSLAIKPPKKFCFFNNQLLARAILSWNVAPPANDPDFTPIWGNIHDTRIQIPGYRLFPLKDLLAVAKVKLPPEILFTLDLEQEVPAAQPKALAAGELQALYRDKGVEPHRFALKEIQQFIGQPTPGETVQAAGVKAAIPGLDLDLSDIIGKLFPTDGDTRYEELECVGLNPNTDTLVGVIRVKLPTGYSGGPCTAGSKEYVTFWADFNNNGTFETCLGTASVTVHDIALMPKEGFEYAVVLPIDLTHQRQPCKDGAKVLRIRAILSWNVAPPCANPNYVPVWGNREETLIHIAPGPKIPPGTVIPLLSILGGIPVSKINDITGLTTADAIFALNNLAPDSLGRPCPFGGRVSAQGPQYVGFKYMVEVKRVVDVAWTAVTTPLQVVDLNGNVSPHLPDMSGKFLFLPFTQNIANLLALWDTSGDDVWEVRLRIFDLGDNPVPGADIHRIQLDNTGPTASIVIESGAGNCGKFIIGDLLSGHFVARDTWFGSFSLGVLPGVNPPGVGVPVPSGGFAQTAPAPGDPWTLDTTGMQACGYVLHLVVADRAIVNSAGPGNVHYASASAGFCLEAPLP